MVWGGNTQMTYDDSNRVVSVTGYSGGMQNFGYAPDNKRIAATKYDSRYAEWPQIEWTLYGVHGEKLLDFRLTGPDVAGSVDNTTPFINVYPMAVHIPYLGRDIAAGISTDRLGSTQAIEFYPYGEQMGTNAATEGAQFATYYRDGLSGLDYAQNRYYASSLGRFTSPDPYSPLKRCE